MLQTFFLVTDISNGLDVVMGRWMRLYDSTKTLGSETNGYQDVNQPSEGNGKLATVF